MLIAAVFFGKEKYEAGYAVILTNVNEFHKAAKGVSEEGGRLRAKSCVLRDPTPYPSPTACAKAIAVAQGESNLPFINRL